MDTLDAVSDNPIHDYMALLFISVFWFVFALILSVIYFLSPKPTEKWSKPMFYDYNTRVGQFTYIVRIIFETPSTHHDIVGNSILLTLLKEDDTKPLIKINIDETRLKNWSQFREEEPHKSIVRFLLHTSISIDSMDSLVMNLLSGHYLKVFDVEIQDINDWNSEANVAIVGQDIKKLSNKMAISEQNYPISAKRFREIEVSVHTSRLLTSYEYLLFIWTALNLIAFMPSVLIICTDDQVLCDNYNYDYMSSAYTGLTASLLSALLFFVLIAIFRFLIKYQLEKRFGSKLWSTVRYLYLVMVFSIGVLSAVFASILVSKHKHSDMEDILQIDVSIYWMVAVSVGITTFMLFWLPMLSLLGNCFNFFSRIGVSIDTEAPTPKEQPKEIPKSDQKPDQKPDPKPDQKADHKKDSKEMEDESNNYFKELTKKGVKVKSISQYQGINQGKRQTEKSDTNSVGDTYFNQLVKTTGNVASVSQYANQKQ